MADRYAVFGNPIEHSRSPEIHGLFAQQTGQDMVYERQRVDVGGFETAADGFFNSGGKGLNITVPFKLDAFGYASELTARARLAGAVNTLALKPDGGVLGDNTDGAGLVRDMVVNLGWVLKQSRVLILGAGGAVRGILEPLLAEGPGEVVIANRTGAKADRLAKLFARRGNIRGCGFEGVGGEAFDIIVNGTSASLAGELPPLADTLVTPSTCAYDMMYGAAPTVFLAWAQQRNAASSADGLGMLVEQAAESFLLWRGVRPSTTEVIARVRARLQVA